MNEAEPQRLARLCERKFAALVGLKKSLLHQSSKGQTIYRPLEDEKTGDLLWNSLCDLINDRLPTPSEAIFFD